MADLVIGGTSGLGLELARALTGETDQVIITGRHDPQEDNLEYRQLDLNGPGLPQRIGEFAMALPEVKTLVYAAGFAQMGRLAELSNEQIEAMLDVGERAMVYFVRDILRKQGQLAELILITSTSQWTPRQYEPIYNLVKAAEGMFGNAMAEDGRVDRVLVAGPAGMRTGFWRNNPEQDQTDMLDPKWVSDQVMLQRAEDYRYRFVKILRLPPRVELVESR